MKIILDSELFKKGLRSAYGIVNDKNIIAQLQTFYFKTIEGYLYVAGSDGNITFLSKIKAKYEDYKDMSFILKAAVLYNFVKDTTSNVELTIEGGLCQIKTEFGESKILLENEEEYLEINFDAFDINEVDDKFKAEELRYILQSLLPILAKTSMDNSYRVIYCDSEKFYASDSKVISYIVNDTNKKYVFKEKDAQCLIDVIENFQGDISFKYIDDGTSVLVKAGESTFTFRCFEDEDMLDIDRVMDIKADFAIVVDKDDLVKKINLTVLLSDDNNIEFIIEKDMLTMLGSNQSGEESNFSTKVLKSQQLNDKVKISVLATNLVKLVRICKEKVIIINFNLEESTIKLTDLSKKTLSLMSIN